MCPKIKRAGGGAEPTAHKPAWTARKAARVSQRLMDRGTMDEQLSDKL